MIRIIKTDQSQRELSDHGSVQFPLEINYDNLNDFQNRHMRCHWHDELEISIVLNGTIRYQLKDHTLIFRTGEGVLINSRVPHSAFPLSSENPLLLTIILHPALVYGTPSSEIYQKLMLPYMQTPSLSQITLSDNMIDTLKQIASLYTLSPFGCELKIKGQLCCLFYELLTPHEKLLACAGPSDEEALARLKILLEQIHAHYAEPLSLASLASEVSLSREGCCRFFKAMTGQTLSQYLEDYRISQSILYLKDNQYSITQIAAFVGFNNSGRFSAAFVKRMSCTPSQYRHSLQK
ncbi:MAG: helix-turn-helix transcriptional regulator [Clostridiales bacterium]|nr:helix-turn-helix transcriptional regulator [Clostridiales bacterium]